ncbi:MAG TPA: proteasome-activating nucleotidase [Candidatus Binatia bacterium]|nr:proteasome-activating nucleotidase [Candidatus Binatia bacterium]
MTNAPAKESKDKTEAAFYAYVNNVSGLEDENRALKEHNETLERELEKYRRAPLIVCEVRDIVEHQALIRLPNGNEFLVEVSTDCEPLAPGDGIVAEQKNLTVIRKIMTNKKFDVERFVVIDKPTVPWAAIGGLHEQERDIKEVIELPLKKPQLFKEVGIQPPKGILLHGPPGTGKTLLAKAVAASTNSTFIEVVGSELVQKFIGEGAKLVKEIFQLAREKAPSIVFIDEIDAIAATRVDVGTSGEREVQRTFMQLLAEIDGFEPLGNVKIIGCTNRKDILDPAIVRPGRLDRLIFVPLPDEEGRHEILRIHTKDMKLERKLDLDALTTQTEGFSGAELKAICTEAGYCAIRSDRTKVTMDDFIDAVQKVGEEVALGNKDYLKMFG